MIKLLYIVLCVILINCASSSAGIATSNIPIVNKKYKVIGPVEMKNTWMTLDIAILAVAFSTPPINEMMDDMIRSKEAVALINIRYWQDRSVFLFLTRNRLSVNAEAVKFIEDAVPETNAKKTR